MTEHDLDLERRADLERRFDGPIPHYLTETASARARQRRGTRHLVERMAADYGRAVWLHLAATTAAWRAERHAAAARHRARLDAAARSLASVLDLKGISARGWRDAATVR